MIQYKPKYFYGGHNGVPSDSPFIERHLERLHPSLQKVAAEEYQRLYLYYFNLKEYTVAREVANGYLEQFANNNGGPLKKLKTLEASEENKKKVAAMVERVKRTQKNTKKSILGMSEWKKN